MLRLEPFLTAYDPSDLPGGSIDPLGFEAGYLFLAEKLLPDLTNVASRPRYFSVLCAGSYLADCEPDMTPLQQYRQRLECIQRLERLWILANVLASKRDADGRLPTDGIRGITYAESRVAEIDKKGQQSVSHEYRLLSRQTPYGLVGIYAAIAERFRMIDRSTFALTQDSGVPLAEAFVRETKLLKEVSQGVRDGSKVPLEVLSEWGKRSHISGVPSKLERECFQDAAFNRNQTRMRMLSLLEKYPYANQQESELVRMRRIVKALEDSDDNPDLIETMRLVLEYEACYRLVLLGLERLLWLCRVLPAASISLADLLDDKVMALVISKLPPAFSRFSKAVDMCATPESRQEIARLDNVKAFLSAAVEACKSPNLLADVILDRHRDVQGGKFDRGRRKMPWIQRQDGHIALTLTRGGGRNREITSPDELEPHVYRFFAGDQLLKAARGL